VSLQNYIVNTSSVAQQRVFAGNGASDTSPTFVLDKPIPVQAGTLSVSLPGPSVVVLTLQGTSANGLNLISDPGFENADLNSWSMTNNSTVILTPYANSGMQALEIPSGMGVYQNVPLTKRSKNCTLGGWGRLSSTKRGQAQLGIRGTVDDQPWNQAVAFTSNSYEYRSQKFDIPNRLRNIDVWISNGSTGNLFLDDLWLSCR
jgi:hypothetical protein